MLCPMQALVGPTAVSLCCPGPPAMTYNVHPEIYHAASRVRPLIGPCPAVACCTCKSRLRFCLINPSWSAKISFATYPYVLGVTVGRAAPVKSLPPQPSLLLPPFSEPVGSGDCRRRATDARGPCREPGRCRQPNIHAESTATAQPALKDQYMPVPSSFLFRLVCRQRHAYYKARMQPWPCPAHVHIDRGASSTEMGANLGPLPSSVPLTRRACWERGVCF